MTATRSESATGGAPTDTQRLEYIIKLALERSIWLTHQNIPEGSIAHMQEGPHRWIIGGQGVGTTGSGKTLREAIDKATGAASRVPSGSTTCPRCQKSGTADELMGHTCRVPSESPPAQHGSKKP